MVTGKNILEQALSAVLIVLILFSCDKESKSLAESKTETAEAIQYVHLPADTFYYEGGLDPDSVYEELLKGRNNTNTKEDWNLVADTEQGRIYISKMQEIKKNAALIPLYHFPPQARIVEYVKISSAKNRMMVLWMKDCRTHIDLYNEYTCPEYSRGKAYFEGEVWLSLVDTEKRIIINSVRIQRNDTYVKTDTTGYKISYTLYAGLDLPVSIVGSVPADSYASGKYYTNGGSNDKEGKALIMYLQDYNKDGRIDEFSLHENDGCMITSATILGYSTIQDRVIQYEVIYEHHELTSKNADTTYTEHSTWLHGLAFVNARGLHYPFESIPGYNGSREGMSLFTTDYNKEKEMFYVKVEPAKAEE